MPFFARGRRLVVQQVVSVAQPEPADAELIDLLVQRDGRTSTIVLRDGRRLVSLNIAWGYDMGDQFAHVTTNSSLFIDGASIDVFFTNEVQAVLAGDGGVIYGSV